MSTAPALRGVKVVEAATIFAGPLIATLMGDFGADVVKVEHPRGDTLRDFGWKKDDVPLWWTIVSRNKRCVTLNLSRPRGGELLLDLLRDADVFIENFRPGTLERWGLGPDRLHAVNPDLIIVRTTGFGQDGPYSSRPGFGTLAEAMSGFAHLNGWPDGPPTLPPLALADTIAALTGAFATMTALHWRDHGGRGQVIDLSIYEPMFWTLGPMALVYDQLGESPVRTGNRAPHTAPRNAYRTSDGRWLALSAAAQSIAERTMRIVGREDLIERPWFADQTSRLQHVDELDEAISAWVAERTADEVLAVFGEEQGAIAPVLAIEDILEHPQYVARETITTVEHPKLGPLRMQNVVPRLSETPGEIRHPGPELGEHNVDVYGELGLSSDDLRQLSDEGVI